MSYAAEISRLNPTCFLFLLDQSGSMNDPMPDIGRRKADFAADAINNLIRNLTLRCARNEGVRDYFHIGVIGYGASVGSAFGGLLSGKEMVPISEIANNPVRIEERNRKIEDGAGGLVNQVDRFPIWFEPIANNGTPMCQALQLAENIMHQWLSQHPDCFPPTILNITDGEANDGDPRSIATRLQQMNSSDGSVLVLNSHISSKTSKKVTGFPDTEDPLPDEFARILFQMSSVMPNKMGGIAKEFGFETNDNSRGYVFNADSVTFIQWLEIGTRAANLR